MKICVISTSVFSVPVAGYSGLEHLAWQQAKGLAELGHQVALVAPDGSFCPNVEIIPTGPAGQWDERATYSKYWQFLPNFEVIIDHSWQKWAYILKMEGKLSIPILGVCHAPINTMYATLPPGVDLPCFVCISQDQANHFLAIHSREAKVAYNGVDTEFYQPLNIPRTDRFLFLARFSTIKGPDIAIEACLKAGVGLDVVGDTSLTQEPELLEKCKKMADGKQIKIIGPATRGECVYWMSQAHCMIHPNQRFREPFGLAPVEAMACGCPVIAWDNGAMRETIPANLGWTVNSFDKLVNILKNAKESNGVFNDWMVLKDVRNKVREYVQRFSIGNMISRYEELCREAIETGGW